MPAQNQGQVTTENTLTGQDLNSRGKVLESPPIWTGCGLYCVNSGSERAIVPGLFIHLIDLIINSPAEMLDFSLPRLWSFYELGTPCLVCKYIFLSGAKYIYG